MAHAEVPPFRNPLERIGDTVREIPVWMGRHWKSVLLITAAGGAAISLNFLHDRGSQNPAVTVNNPISDTLKPADPSSDSEVVVPAVVPTEVTPAAGASASPEPPPTPESTPTQGAIKGVINNKTANLVNLPPSEVQKIVDQAKEKGDTVIALPDWIRKEDVEIREFTNTQGKKQFAVIAPNGKYELPALAGGRISNLLVGPNSNFNGITVSVGAGEDWFVYLPASGSSTRQFGQEITADHQTLVTFDHNPDSKAGQNFQRFLKTQVATNPNNPLPPNTMAIIGLVKTDNPNSAAGTVNLTFQQLARDSQNNIAVTVSK